LAPFRQILQIPRIFFRKPLRTFGIMRLARGPAAGEANSPAAMR
jgi:hypothetical protein